MDKLHQLKKIEGPKARVCPFDSPIIFWRIDSFAQTFRAAAIDLSLALRGENQLVFLNVSSGPRAPLGRKGALPATLSMRPTSLFSNGLAAASQPCGPTPLISKPASAFVTGHLGELRHGPCIFFRGLCLPTLRWHSDSSLCSWVVFSVTSVLFLSDLCVKSLPLSPKTKSAPISRSAFPFSNFYFLNILRLFESPATLPWCSPASALSGRSTN